LRPIPAAGRTAAPRPVLPHRRVPRMARARVGPHSALLPGARVLHRRQRAHEGGRRARLALFAPEHVPLTLARRLEIALARHPLLAQERRCVAGPARVAEAVPIVLHVEVRIRARGRERRHEAVAEGQRVLLPWRDGRQRRQGQGRRQVREGRAPPRVERRGVGRQRAAGAGGVCSRDGGHRARRLQHGRGRLWLLLLLWVRRRCGIFNRRKRLLALDGRRIVRSAELPFDLRLHALRRLDGWDGAVKGLPRTRPRTLLLPFRRRSVHRSRLPIRSVLRVLPLSSSLTCFLVTRTAFLLRPRHLRRRPALPIDHHRALVPIPPHHRTRIPAYTPLPRHSRQADASKHHLLATRTARTTRAVLSSFHSDLPLYMCLCTFAIANNRLRRRRRRPLHIL
ncbi:hypothetical protein BJ912DRAFT_1002788, partial [Pholiota molesta]